MTKKTPINGPAKAPSTQKQKTMSERVFSDVTSWKFITGFALAIGGAAWAKMSESRFAIYGIGLGLCVLLFLIAQRVARKSWIRLGIPSILSCMVIMGSHTIVDRIAKEQRDFSILCHTAIIAERNERAPLLVVYDEAAHPAHIACFMFFTNRRNDPVTVLDFSFENRTLNGWKKVNRFDVRGGEVYGWPSKDVTKNLHRVTFKSPPLEGAFTVNAIPPKFVVSGSILMEYPKFKLGAKWRMRLKEINGDESIIPFELPSSKDGGSLHSYSIEIGEKSDVSKKALRFKYDP